MSAIDTSKMSKGKAEAMEVAEENRQATWDHPSFAGELFMGRFHRDLAWPYPVQGAEAKALKRQINTQWIYPPQPSRKAAREAADPQWVVVA